MGKNRKGRRPTEEVNASSMADIAFLLLIFFLVTTTIVNEKGVRVAIPKIPEEEVDVPTPGRNMFVVILNSNNDLLVENKIMDIKDLRYETKRFLNNRGKDATMSTSPAKAIVSFKADRGTNFKTYLQTWDELQGAYNELRADYLGLTIDEYLALDPTDPEDNLMIKEAKGEYPPTLSKAEPNDFSK